MLNKIIYCYIACRFFFYLVSSYVNGQLMEGATPDLKKRTMQQVKCESLKKNFVCSL